MIENKKMTVAVIEGCVEAARNLEKREGIPFNAAYDRILNARSDFPKAVEKVMTQKKVKCGSAVKIVTTEQPKLHNDWLSAIQKGA